MGERESHVSLMRVRLAQRRARTAIDFGLDQRAVPLELQPVLEVAPDRGSGAAAVGRVAQQQAPVVAAHVHRVSGSRYWATSISRSVTYVST